MIESRRLALGAAFLGVAAMVAFEPALAAPIPGPVIGAGVPALALFAGGYWLIRRMRRGEDAD